MKQFQSTTTPLCVLKDDQDWDAERPRPIEPMRYGRIVISDPQRFKLYPELDAILRKRKYIGSYFEPQIVQRALKDFRITLTQEENKILSIASKIMKDGDYTGAAVISSLVFPTYVFESICHKIHEKLVALAFKPNKEIVGKVSGFITNAVNLKVIQEVSKERVIVIYDPFGGGGALGYLIAEQLVDNGISRFKIIISDINTAAYTNTKELVGTLFGGYYSKFSKYLEFSQRDGITMEGIKVSSLDFLVSTLSLHEHPKKRILEFFRNVQRTLRQGGQGVIVDTTRELSIVKRARRLMPILSRLGSFVVGLAHLTATKKMDSYTRRFFTEAIKGDPYTTLSGIRSYECGLLDKELLDLAVEAGVPRNNVKSFYNREPPIGSLEVIIRKKD